MVDEVVGRRSSVVDRGWWWWVVGGRRSSDADKVATHHPRCTTGRPTTDDLVDHR